MNKALKVVVCGGGRTGHLNAVLFQQAEGVKVTLLSRNAEALRQAMPSDGIEAKLPDGTIWRSVIDITDDPAEAMAGADIIILTVPAHVRQDILKSIAPHISEKRRVFVGAIPGFCGFDWLAAQELRSRDNAVIWGMKDVPYTAYLPKPGASVTMGGAKQKLYVATHGRHGTRDGEELLSHLKRLYPADVELLNSYFEITLTPGNPIMHSSVLYGLIGPYSQWDGKPFQSEVYWWKDCPEMGAYFIQRCDEETQLLCKALQQITGKDLSSVRPIKDEIIDAYPDQIADPRTLLSVLRTNAAYLGKVPLVPSSDGAGLVVDVNSRAFQEDVPYGLALLVEISHRLGVVTPHLDEVFRWCVQYMGTLRHSALEYFPETWPERLT